MVFPSVFFKSSAEVRALTFTRKLEIVLLLNLKASIYSKMVDTVMVIKFMNDAAIKDTIALNLKDDDL